MSYLIWWKKHSYIQLIALNVNPNSIKFNCNKHAIKCQKHYIHITLKYIISQLIISVYDVYFFSRKIEMKGYRIKYE